MTVLVVDDESGLRTLIRNYLEKEGFRVLEAGNGQEAARLLVGSTVHIILSDIRMPVMDGVELYSRVKQNHPEIPFVFISTSSRQDVEHFHGPLDAEFFEKPIALKSLAEELCRILGRGSFAWPHDVKRILVVDDLPEMRDLVSALLRHADFQVESVAHGKKAVETFCSQGFDAVVIHLQSRSGSSGLELLSRIRDTEEGFPVIVISGTPELIESCRNQATAVLGKPFDPQELVSALNHAFRQKGPG